MAVKGAKNPFNICYATVKTSKIDGAGVVTPGPDIQYYFQSSIIYKDAEVAKRTGIVYVDPDKWQGEEPLIKVEQMILSRKLVRLVGEYTDLSGGNRTVSFLATRSLVGGLLSDDDKVNLNKLNVIGGAKNEKVGTFFGVRTATRNSFS